MKRTISALTFAVVLTGAPANAAVEACMVGTWVADLGDVADMIALQMEGEATPKGGEMSMQIGPDGSFTLLVSNMQIGFQMPDMPPFDVNIVGYSAGQFDAAANTFMATVDDYDLLGSADVLGTTMEIPFSSDTGIGGGGTGWFECSGDTLRFEPNVGGVTSPSRMPRLWQRQ